MFGTIFGLVGLRSQTVQTFGLRCNPQKSAPSASCRALPPPLPPRRMPKRRRVMVEEVNEDGSASQTPPSKPGGGKKAAKAAPSKAKAKAASGGKAVKKKAKRAQSSDVLLASAAEPGTSDSDDEVDADEEGEEGHTNALSTDGTEVLTLVTAPAAAAGAAGLDIPACPRRRLTCAAPAARRPAFLQVNVDIEFFDPKEIDFHAVRLMLQVPAACRQPPFSPCPYCLRCPSSCAVLAAPRQRSENGNWRRAAAELLGRGGF